MSFLAGGRLWLVLVPLALAVAYVVVQRQRKKYTVRFTNLDLLASVAPKAPGWQRHVPPALLVLSLVSLVVGFARPTKTIRVAKERGTVLLTIDTSASMNANDVNPNRLKAATGAARSFVEGLPQGLLVGLVTFDKNARLVVPPTVEHERVLDSLGSLKVGPGTATGDAIDLSVQAVGAVPKTADGKPAPALIVLMSDGAPTIPANDVIPAEDVAVEAAANAKLAGIAVDTIAFGTANGVVTIQNQRHPVPSDPETMARIAEASGGQTFAAETGGQLEAIYDQIGRAVGFDKQKSEITAWFTGLGLLIASLAAAAALLWTQRIL
jgi:Ca-activated chloride channel homolog